MDIYIKYERCFWIGLAVLNSKMSLILFLVSKLAKIVENLYGEDQILVFMTSKNHELLNQYKFGLFSSIAFEYSYLIINN